MASSAGSLLGQRSEAVHSPVTCPLIRLSSMVLGYEKRAI